MRYSKTDLLQLKDYHLLINEDLQFTDIDNKFDRIRKIEKIHVKADGKYNPEEQRLYVNLKVSGTIVVGCDVTNEDVQLPIDSEDDVIFTFNRKEEDIDIIKATSDHIELLPTIFQLILLDIPIKVVKTGEIEYPKGDGWEVMSEQQYQAEKKKRIDPRLAKLKEYIPQDE